MTLVIAFLLVLHMDLSVWWMVPIAFVWGCRLAFYEGAL
jgi:hypothetical protein